MKFRATIEQSGKTATGIRVPDAVVESLGAGKRPAVRVTIRGHTYRSTVASLGGAFMIGVRAENRTSAGVVAGDEVDVEIELDTAPREVTLPPDFAKALKRDAAARRTFDDLSFSNKQWHVLSIEGAKTDELDSGESRSPSAGCERAGRAEFELPEDGLVTIASSARARVGSPRLPFRSNWTIGRRHGRVSRSLVAGGPGIPRHGIARR